MTDFKGLLSTLVENGVDFVLVGGVAGIAHGAARATYDLDVVYARAPDNVRRLACALSGLSPYLRGAPPGLPFVWDESTILRGLNFSLTTSLGDLDLLGELTGGGNYADLVPESVQMEMFGRNCLVLDLEKLIQVKRAAGRPKDLEAIAELEAILEEGRSD